MTMTAITTALAADDPKTETVIETGDCPAKSRRRQKKRAAIWALAS